MGRLHPPDITEQQRGGGSNRAATVREATGNLQGKKAENKKRTREAKKHNGEPKPNPTHENDFQKC
jgi:hypothetical protein